MTISVSVGICAYNEEGRLPRAIGSLLGQRVPAGFELREVLVVASGCTDGTERTVETWAEIEPRIRLLREARRNGKASALNLILRSYGGDILVLLNADARIGPRALEHLLLPFLESEGVEIACGRPVPETSSASPRDALTEFLWRIHNRTLETLSTLRLENHCCDEFMAIRRGFVDELPPNLINDGAYLGVLASLRRRSVRFCPDAEVIVETQSTLRGVLRQRRRTIWAHRQVKGLLDHPSNTFRSLAQSRPGLAAKVLVNEFVARPAGIPVFVLLVLPLEAVASFLALIDSSLQKPYQPAWPVVD